jgi:hypothetical protein
MQHFFNIMGLHLLTKTYTIGCSFNGFVSLELLYGHKAGLQNQIGYDIAGLDRW